MKLANIIPPDWIRLFPTSDYRMALAHWVFEYPDYAEGMRKGAGGQEAYILMDSGTFEDKQVNITRFNEAIDAIRADEIVLPDAAGDYKATLKRSWNALGKIAVKRVMFAPQGRTHEEWCACLTSWINQWIKHDWKQEYDLSIGVASLREPNSTKSVIGSKAALLREVLDIGYPIHLLGLPHLGNHVSDILPLAFSAGVRGNDTSTAFALGAKGILVTPSAKKIHLGDPEKYTTLDTRARRLIVLNMGILNEWTATGKGSHAISTVLIRETAKRWVKYWQEGFAPLAVAMQVCGMPSGRYALLKERRREKYVRPLTHFQKLEGKETLIELKEKKHVHA